MCIALSIQISFTESFNLSDVDPPPPHPGTALCYLCPPPHAATRERMRFIAIPRFATADSGAILRHRYSHVIGAPASSAPPRWSGEHARDCTGSGLTQRQSIGRRRQASNRVRPVVHQLEQVYGEMKSPGGGGVMPRSCSGCTPTDSNLMGRETRLG